MNWTQTPPTGGSGTFPAFQGPLLARIWDKSQASREARAAGVHQHREGQLCGATEGLLTVRTGDTRWAVPALHAIWIPPRREHGIDPHGQFDGWAMLINETLCQGLPAEPCILRVSGLLMEAVKRVADWDEQSWAPERDPLVAVIAAEIRGLPNAPLGLVMPPDPRLARIADALLRDPADRRGQAEWASWAGLSPRTLSRRFPRETGLGFQAWRQRARLLRALEHLAAGLPVTTVALESGYQTTSAFIEAFGQVFGMTPGRWRGQGGLVGRG